MSLLKSVIKPLGSGYAWVSGYSCSSCISHRCCNNQKILGSGTTTLIISNDEINDILKIDKSLEDSGVFLKGVNETVKKEGKEQKGVFFIMVLGTISATLLGNMLAGKWVIRAGEGRIRAGYGCKSSLKKF